MDDLISRQAAIDGADAIIARDTSGNNDVVKAMTAWKSYVEALPSVQTEVEKDTNVPINDCISRQAAIEAAVEAADKWDGGYNYERQLIIEEALARIPSAERKKGKWEYKMVNEGVIGFRCSACGDEVLLPTPFCRNCGEDMRGETDE